MDFAFLVHSRDYKDIYKKYKIAKVLPKKIIEAWCFRWPPILVSKITGLKSIKTGEELKGYIIGVPMTARQMMENRELARNRVVQAINKAEKFGVKVVGLGALTSSVTGGGLLIKDEVNIKITSGHAYTAFIVTSYVFKAINELSLKRDKIIIAIVGAAGSIGSTCAQILSKKGINNLLLIDLERKNNNLRKLVKNLEKSNPKLKINSSHKIKDIKKADVIIAATNAPEALIKPNDLKIGAVIIDDAQPSDISPEITKEREDVLVIDGGIVSAPNVNINFNFGLVNKDDIYSCLGEVMIFSSINKFFKYKIFEIDSALIDDISRTGNDLGFKINNFQRFGKIYSREKIKKIKKIILKRAIKDNF